MRTQVLKSIFGPLLWVKTLYSAKRKSTPRDDRRRPAQSSSQAPASPPGEAEFGIDAGDAQRRGVNRVAIGMHLDGVVMLNCLRHITV
jgi:hypothetical protein